MSTTESVLEFVTAGNPTPPSILGSVFFSWVDYLLFFLMLGFSAVIGIYFGFFGKKQDNTTEYLMGGKTMGIFPIAMSLIASHLSGITVLGIPAEIYNFGTQYWMCIVTGMITGVVIIYVYLPVFYKLQLTSSYEYLQLRFSSHIRTLASFLFAFSMLLYIPVVIYVPALAFSQVTGLSIYIITPITCIICIFYTSLGGLKAVVWTDTLQTTVMLGSMFTVMGLGVASAGGFINIFTVANEGGRLEFFNMSPDLTLRNSFWGITVAMTFSWITHIGVTQCSVQRFLAVPSYSAAKKSVLYLFIGLLTMKSITCAMGLLMYAKYEGCDPLKSGQIQKADQILPYYIMDVAGHIPGLPGLFIAGVFSAALSSMSTGLNTLAGTIYEDFLSSFMPANTTEKRASDIMKIISLSVGILCTAMVFIVEKAAGIIQLSYSLSGITTGPMFGLFTLGMLSSTANTKGALSGAVTSLVLMTFLVVGNQYYVANGYRHLPKELNIDKCPFEVPSNVTLLPTTTPNPCDDELPPFIFRISFYYYTVIGATVLIVVAIIVSWITRRKDDKPVHPDYLSPVIYWTLPSDYKCDARPERNSVMHALQIITNTNTIVQEYVRRNSLSKEEYNRRNSIKEREMLLIEKDKSRKSSAK